MAEARRMDAERRMGLRPRCERWAARLAVACALLGVADGTTRAQVTTQPQAQAVEAGPVVAVSPAVFEAVSQFYEYDATVPLDVVSAGTRAFPTFTREKIVFTGIQRSRVPGYLALPAQRTGRVPVVILIDGVTGTKDRWFVQDNWPHGLLVTRALIDAGMAVLALDARYHGERAAENDYRTPQFSARPPDRDMMVQSIIEHRRAMDVLATRPEIDTGRIGVLGLSMGGIMTFALTSLDPRVKAAVAGVTPIRPVKAPAGLPIAPMTFAQANTGTPFLMLMGRTDEGYYSVEDAEQLFAIIASPRKELEIYDAGHRLPAEYAGRAARWLQTHLE